MTGVSLGTVKSRIHRGRLALRDLLERPDGAVPWLSAAARTPPMPITTCSLSRRCWTTSRRPSDRQAGEALVASCPECAALHADLLALSSATAELPTRLARAISG